MKQIVVLALVSIFLASCFLVKPYRVENFSFTSGNTNYSVPLVVPRGYSKKWVSQDSSGNNILTYQYKDGSIFYLAHVKDTSVDLQPLEWSENIARQSHHTGALIYKGMDKDHLFWREVRQKNFRSGYRFVNGDEEYRFDSATNYLVVWEVGKIR
jgi:hypothetical protein